MASERPETNSPEATEGAERTPRTARGRRTQRALLDAAAAEFAAQGFHESSIAAITRRAGVALGSFYTYFSSKDELFRALVQDMSDQVRAQVSPALAGPGDLVDRESAGLRAFLAFAREHNELYRIVDEAEFVAPETWRAHYEVTARRIAERLRGAAAAGEISAPVDEAHAWALMGMYVFLGLRFGVLDRDRPIEEVVAVANGLLRRGLGPGR